MNGKLVEREEDEKSCYVTKGHYSSHCSSSPTAEDIPYSTLPNNDTVNMYCRDNVIYTAEEQEELTVNVPLFKKLQDIIFTSRYIPVLGCNVYITVPRRLYFPALQ